MRRGDPVKARKDKVLEKKTGRPETSRYRYLVELEKIESGDTIMLLKAFPCLLSGLFLGCDMCQGNRDTCSYPSAN